MVALDASLLAIGWYAWRWLPRPDHPTIIDANGHGLGTALVGRPRLVEPILGPALAEKVALVVLVSITFAGFLPGVHASVLQMTIAVALLVVANSAVSSWTARRGRRWRTAALEFILMCTVNVAMVLVLEIASRWSEASLSATSALFYVLLLSLLISLHDRYRQLRVWRLISVDASTTSPRLGEAVP